MPDLQLLRPEHERALLAFELENRSYFAASIPDRGDAYFATFSEGFAELLVGQAEGADRLHVLVEEDGSIVGRVNLTDVSDGSAELGYRIAERVAGRGVATAAVREVCGRAFVDYGLRVLQASATVDNVASRTVLERVGFLAIGAVTLNGRPAVRYRRDLSRPS